MPFIVCQTSSISTISIQLKKIAQTIYMHISYFITEIYKKKQKKTGITNHIYTTIDTKRIRAKKVREITRIFKGVLNNNLGPKFIVCSN